MSAKVVDQKAYLQKYLGGSSSDKKKKKKKSSKGKGFQIIDDDLDVTKMRPLEGDELDVYGEGEDAPQVAGIIDERPEEVKKMEQFQTTSKWRVINKDDGFNSKLQIEEIKRDVKETQKDNEMVFGKMYSDSEDEQKNDSDASPPRKPSSNTERSNNKKPQNNSDSDFSPPRKSNKDSIPKSRSEKISEKNYDSDLSPPRKHKVGQKSKVRRKPSRWGDEKDRESPKRHRNRSRSPKISKDSDSDQSPPRRNNCDSVTSRKRKTNHDSDSSPPRKPKDQTRHQSPSPDSSRRKKSPDRTRKNNSTNYDQRKSSKEQRNRSPDSDVSPPRRKPEFNKHKLNDRPSKSKYGERSKRKQSPDSDLSPPRKKSSSRRELSPDRRKKKQGSDSDMSPPRKSNSNMENRYKRSSNSPPPTNKKMARTLEGKLAGLQDATQLRQENEAFRRREDEAFSRLNDDVSGRNAKAVSRKSKRETSEERQKLTEKAQRQKELDEKYKRWGKGLKQLEDQQSRQRDFAHESSKPLARLAGDTDLEQHLQMADRDGDPMLQYIRERKRERGELPPEKPQYKGQCPPNRFNIRPGYRWDGVDRSNGYENKYFAQQSKKKAQQEEAYRWSTDDL